MNTPDVPRMLLVVNIPGKYFRLVLYAIFALLGRGSVIGHGLSVAFGYAHSYGYLDKLKVHITILTVPTFNNTFLYMFIAHC
jgi:hypothetical protein